MSLLPTNVLTLPQERVFSILTMSLSVDLIQRAGFSETDAEGPFDLIS